MPTDRTVDYIELPALDLDAAQVFYERAFDWSFTDYGPDYRSFQTGTIAGGFFRSDARSSTENGAALIVVYATDLKRTKERVLASGGSIVKDVFSFPGGRRFHFTDPNRNELAVWSEE